MLALARDGVTCQGSHGVDDVIMPARSSFSLPHDPEQLVALGSPCNRIRSGGYCFVPFGAVWHHAIGKVWYMGSACSEIQGVSPLANRDHFSLVNDFLFIGCRVIDLEPKTELHLAAGDFAEGHHCSYKI